MNTRISFALYNPSILREDTFLAGYVARGPQTETMLSRLREIPQTGVSQHHLILGQRGMGKTSLLRRLAIAINREPELSGKLLPLTFREEQYNVHNLHLFWCNCLDALGGWLDVKGDHHAAAALDDDLRRISNLTGDPRGDAALAAFKAWMVRLGGRRPVLFIDNLDIILSGLKRFQEELRQVLQERGGVVVVGASATYLEALVQPEGAFYDLFQIEVLQKLTAGELLTCLRQLARQRGPDGGGALVGLADDPSRVAVFHNLTGGNPRTLHIISAMLEFDPGGEVFSHLEGLLDQVTVLYKARIEDLAPQTRVVLDALALAWDPTTAADVALAAGLDTSLVSAQLDRLQKDGIVEKVALSSTRKIGFQVAERFFNIWYLMRHGPRRIQARLRWLTEFLRAFYTPKQLTDYARRLLQERGSERDGRSEYYIALTDAFEDKAWRNLLGREAVERARRLEAQGGPVLDLSDLPSPNTADDWFQHGRLLAAELNDAIGAEVAYRAAVDLDPSHARAWNGLGLLAAERGDLGVAHQLFSTAIALAPSNGLFRTNRGRFSASDEDAEADLQEAVRLDPDFSYAWFHLGYRLADVRGRQDDAAAAYRNCLALAPADGAALNNLGNIVKDLGESEEAIALFERAVASAPRLIIAWRNLFGLQRELRRDADALAVARRAGEANPEAAEPHRLLGLALEDASAPADVIEAAYRRALALDSKDAESWIALGCFLAKSDRTVEANDVFEQGRDQAPNIAQALHRYLDTVLERLSPAPRERILKTCIAQFGESGHLLNQLAWTISQQIGRNGNALEIFRRCIGNEFENYHSWLGYAYALEKVEGRDAALSALRVATDGYPQSVCLRLALGRRLIDDGVDLDAGLETIRQALALVPQDHWEWCDRGYFLSYYLGDYEGGANSYATALALDPRDLVAQSNLYVLNMVRTPANAPHEQELRRLAARHPAHGAALLEALSGLLRDDFEDAFVHLVRALEGCDDIFDEYGGFFLLFLRMVAVRGYGDTFLNAFRNDGLRDRYWPIDAAFEAYLHGEERLLDVNPEVRVAAAMIHGWLAPMEMSTFAKPYSKEVRRGVPPRKRSARRTRIV